MLDPSDSSEFASHWWLDIEEVCARPELIEPVFQPIVDLRRGQIAGFEALARFSTGPAGSPAQWFAAAALWGQTARLEASVVRVILSHRGTLPPNCFLSLNLSPEAMGSPQVAGVLETEASRAGLHGLVLEITEQAPVEDYERLEAGLAPLRNAGAFVAVDDVGAGYASLRHVMRPRPGFVKLDRDVVAGVHADPSKAAAVAAFGAFAGELDAWITVEGIESAHDLDALVGMGVALGQGYLLGRPGQAWATLNPALGARIQELAARRGDPHARLGALAYHTSPVSAKTGIDAIHQHEHDRRSPVVAVDDYERPVALLVPANDGHWHERPVLCADRTEAVNDVAIRAMARPLEMRFLPVACCDERGPARACANRAARGRISATVGRQTPSGNALARTCPLPTAPRNASPDAADPNSQRVVNDGGLTKGDPRRAKAARCRF